VSQNFGRNKKRERTGEWIKRGMTITNCGITMSTGSYIAKELRRACGVIKYGCSTIGAWN
jgi:hypothetical protein